MTKQTPPVLSDDNLYLYIVARQDLDSMGRGRMASQVAHAANAMVYKYFINNSESSTSKEEQAYVKSWMNQTSQGFGTQITKKVSSLEELMSLKSLFDNAPACSPSVPLVYGLVVDPEYFVPDGTSGHLVTEVPTCFYALLPRDHEFTQKYIRPIPMMDNDAPVRR